MRVATHNPFSTEANVMPSDGCVGPHLAEQVALYQIPCTMLLGSRTAHQTWDTPLGRPDTLGSDLDSVSQATVITQSHVLLRTTAISATLS